MVTNFKQSGSNYSAATNFKQIWIPTESDRLLIHSKLDFCLEFVMDGQKQGESNYSAATNVKQIWVPTESDRLLIHLTFGFGPTPIDSSMVSHHRAPGLLDRAPGGSWGSFSAQ